MLVFRFVFIAAHRGVGGFLKAIMLDKKYIISLRAALAKQGIDEEGKSELVLSATDNRTSSIREMKTVEAIAMLRALNGQQDDYQPDKKLKMKRKILAYCHEMGWELGTGAVDMRRVNDYCLKKGYLNKPFNGYAVGELPKLVQQFQQMHRAYLKK